MVQELIMCYFYTEYKAILGFTNGRVSFDFLTYALHITDLGNCIADTVFFFLLDGVLQRIQVDMTYIRTVYR